MRCIIAFVALSALATCGCELMVGTDEKTVTDAAAVDDGSDAADANAAEGAAEAAASDATPCEPCNGHADACPCRPPGHGN